MLDIAIEAAKAGGQVAYSYFKNIPKVSYKADKSPVTKADKETEKLIRGILGRKFPDHGIIGEELPPTNQKAKLQWVIDPIDGTRDFIRGIPFWSVFVALLKKDKPIISVVYFPVSNELYYAQRGKGAFLNKQKLQVSKIRNLEDAYISHGGLKRFVEKDKENQLEKLCKLTATSRNYGNLGFKLFLEGKLDVLVESYGAFYDFAAPSLITEEAGGVFTDFAGNKLLKSGNGVHTNKYLHKQVINILNSN